MRIQVVAYLIWTSGIHLITPAIAQAACSSPTANIGSLDFQSSAFKYCDGSAWQPLGATTFPILAPSSSANAPSFSFAAGTNTGMFSTGAGTIAFSTAGQERLRIDSSGNVGIGTTAPSAPLHVKVANGDNASIRLERSNNTDRADFALSPQGVISGTNVQWNFGLPANTNDFRLSSWDGTSTNYRVTILNNGNVGIGTSNPQALLHVRGGGQLISNDGYANLDVRAYSASVWPQLILRRSLDVVATPVYPSSANILGGVEFRNYNAGDGSGVLGYATENHSASAAGSGLRFMVIPNGSLASTVAVTVASNGSVGIGTTAPGASLQVYGEDNAAQVIRNDIFTDTGAAYFTGQRARGTKSSPTAVTANSKLTRFSGGGWNGSSFANGGALEVTADLAWASGDHPGRIAFYTVPDNGTTEIERLRIDSGGDVGIGTTGPATGARLDVHGGAIAAGSQSSTLGGEVRFYESGGTNFVAFRGPTALASDVTWTLPAAAGTTSQVLSTNAAGSLSWVNATPTYAKFRVHRNSSTQTITSAGVSLNWTTEDFDTANAFDLTTDRFTPTVAGYYQIHFAYRLDMAGFADGITASIQRNGATIATSSASGDADLDIGSVTVSTVIYFNGSTDYVSAYASQTGGTGKSLRADPTESYFEGFQLP